MNRLFCEAYFGNWFISNNFGFERFLCWLHMVLRKLLTLSDGLVNRSFRRLDNLRVQLRWNWRVGEKLLACDQQAVCKCRLLLFKEQWHFEGFPKILTWKNHFVNKINCFIAFEIIVFEGALCWWHTCTTHGTAQTFSRSCKPIILLIGDYKGPTEVQPMRSEGLLATF